VSVQAKIIVEFGKNARKPTCLGYSPQDPLVRGVPILENHFHVFSKIWIIAANLGFQGRFFRSLFRRTRFSVYIKSDSPTVSGGTDILRSLASPLTGNTGKGSDCEQGQEGWNEVAFSLGDLS